MYKLSVLLLICLLLVAVSIPTDALAQWEDRSGELEEDHTLSYVLLGATAVLLVVIIASNASKSKDSLDTPDKEEIKKSKEKETGEPWDYMRSIAANSSPIKYTIQDQKPMRKNGLRIIPVFGVKSLMRSNPVVVGLSVKF